MDANTLTVAEARQTAVPATHAGNRDRGTDPKHMAVMKGWDSMMRGARKYCEKQGFVTIHNMPHIMGVTGVCERNLNKLATQRPASPGAFVFSRVVA